MRLPLNWLAGMRAAKSDGGTPGHRYAHEGIRAASDLAPARAHPPPTTPRATTFRMAPAPPLRLPRRRLAVGWRPLTCSGTGRLGWVGGPSWVPGTLHPIPRQQRRNMPLIETRQILLQPVQRHQQHRKQTHFKRLLHRFHRHQVSPAIKIGAEHAFPEVGIPHLQLQENGLVRKRAIQSVLLLGLVA